MRTNPTQSSSEELREYFKKIVHLGFDPVFLKLNQDIDELVDKTAEAAMIKFTSHLQAYTDEIRGEVIGENETVNDIENPSWDDMRRQAAALGKNQLKALQRQALNNLATKWGMK